MKTNQVLCRLLALAALTGCSSGSSTPLSPVGAPSARATGPAASSLARAAVTISIPRTSTSAAARTRTFVSPSTSGVSVAVTHVTSGVIDYNVTTNYDVGPNAGANCSGTDPEVCTLQIPAPIATSPDFDSFTFTLYDQAPGGTANTFGTSAKILGTGSTTASITANAANAISAYIDGIPKSVTFVSGTAPQALVTGDGYLGFSAVLGAEALDVDLNAITAGAYDPYDPSFAIAVTEPISPTGSTTLSLTPADYSADSPPAPACNAAAVDVSTVTTCRSSDVITVNYLQSTPATINASYFAQVTSGTKGVPATRAVYISPIFVNSTTTSSADPNSSQTQFTQGVPNVSPLLALGGGTGSVLPDEPGGDAEGAFISYVVSENADCNGVIAPNGISENSDGSFAITGVSLASAMDDGACVVTFADGHGGTVQLQVGDTAPAATSSIRRKQHR